MSETDASERKQFAYVIRPPRATFAHDASDDERAVVAGHFQYLERLCGAGTVLLAGRCDDATFGIVILEASDEPAARRVMADDPVVRLGLFSAEFHPFRVALMRDDSRE